MSDIVIELKRRNWSDIKIAREPGMEPDEVLRLSQVAGLAEMFADKDFSEAWEPAGGEPKLDSLRREPPSRKQSLSSEFHCRHRKISFFLKLALDKKFDLLYNIIAMNLQFACNF